MSTRDELIGRAVHALARYGRHDEECPLRGGPNLPGDERCVCGFSKVQMALDRWARLARSAGQPVNRSV